MENKTNISELLRDCPKGMELYSPLCGKCFFDRLNMGTIICKKQNTQEITFTSEGYYMLPVFDNCECMIFPSKDQRDWSKFQRPFKDGDILISANGNPFILKEIRDNKICEIYCGIANSGEFARERLFWTSNYNLRLATEGEKEKLFQAIKDNGYKWNPETKALEMLPKFKEGDILYARDEVQEYVYIFKEIKNNEHIYSYIDLNLAFNGNLGISVIWLIDYNDTVRFATEEEKERLFDALRACGYRWNEKTKTLEKLIEPKFNITTLKPFDKVLVRTSSLDKWHIQFFERYDKNASSRYPFVCLCGNKYGDCIPFNGNEHLLNTINDCDDFYKTW